jgi:hypothetical protein
LEGLHCSEIFISEGYIRANIDVAVEKAVCKTCSVTDVDFAYQLSLCSGTEENHGKGSSSLTAGPSGFSLTSSQQSCN